MKTKQLVIYRNFKHQQLFDDMAALLAGEPAQNDSFVCANQLIELASTYGFEGNLWHCFLAFCMANHENAYSTACEIVGEVQGSLNDLAMQDFKILKQLFDYEIRSLDREGTGIWNSMSSYRAANGNSKVFNKRIRDRIVKLAVSLEEAEDEDVFKQVVTEFYREFGVGKFGLNKAFRLEENLKDVNIEPITNVEHVYLKDIIGYELQKKKLIENTEAFIKGKAANNALLYGDAGTGKSSCIKAILNEYYDQGLRIIEVYKHQFRMLSDVLEQVKDRNYKFIVYMDDLSFEDCESEYKYLKAIIEGGLGRKPKNVLIYATSNRRHLIREKFSDKRELQDELHENDTVQEKLSLAARFGVSIYFGAPDKKQFQHIVKTLAEKYNVVMPEEDLLLEANRWELSHGGLSGRTANQFITHLLGKMDL
ncbi:ATP-binding protein [Clostridium sp. chh4-2]|uniref:ATP-binding protein n=1 Tax=Clostridium sp. chh4-2 TaxID=2067550 RepID=UPI0015E1772D|nr:ATP-binding protein [Clostridium sp. chh4-2]